MNINGVEMPVPMFATHVDFWYWLRDMGEPYQPDPPLCDCYTLDIGGENLAVRWNGGAFLELGEPGDCRPAAELMCEWPEWMEENPSLCELCWALFITPDNWEPWPRVPSSHDMEAYS